MSITLSKDQRERLVALRLYQMTDSPYIVKMFVGAPREDDNFMGKIIFMQEEVKQFTEQLNACTKVIEYRPIFHKLVLRIFAQKFDTPAARKEYIMNTFRDIKQPIVQNLAFSPNFNFLSKDDEDFGLGLVGEQIEEVTSALGAVYNERK